MTTRTLTALVILTLALSSSCRAPQPRTVAIAKDGTRVTVLHGEAIVDGVVVRREVD